MNVHMMQSKSLMENPLLNWTSVTYDESLKPHIIAVSGTAAKLNNIHSKSWGEILYSFLAGK